MDDICKLLKTEESFLKNKIIMLCLRKQKIMLHIRVTYKYFSIMNNNKYLPQSLFVVREFA